MALKAENAELKQGQSAILARLEALEAGKGSKAPKKAKKASSRTPVTTKEDADSILKGRGQDS